MRLLRLFASACSVFACVWQPLGASASGSWIALNGIPGASIQTIQFSPAAPAKGFVGSDGGGLFRTINGGASWTREQVGQPNESIAALGLAPGDNNVMYAGSAIQGGAGKVRISTDGGITWTATPAQPPPLSNVGIHITGTVVESLGEAALVSDAFAGIFLTKDRGAHWTNTLSNAAINAMARGSATGSPIWAAGSLFNKPYVFESVDGGSAWLYLSLPGLPLCSNLTNIAADPGRGRVFAAWTTGCPGSTGRTGGLYVSTDGGKTWQAADTGLPLNFVSSALQSWMVFDPAMSGHIIMGALTAGGANAVFESTDGGVSWASAASRVPGEVTAAAIALRPASATAPAALFLGNDDLFSGPLSNAALTPADTGMKNSAVISVSEDGSSPSGLFAATNHGLYHSANFGKTWASVSGWPGSHIVLQFMRDRAPGARSVYVVDGDNRVFVSSDTGASWQDVTPSGYAITGILTDPLLPQRLYATTSGTTFLTSANAGSAWTSGTLPEAIAVPAKIPGGGSTLAVAPYLSGHLYAIASTGGVEVSDDDGATWREPAQQPPMFSSGEPGSIAVEQAAPFTLFFTNGLGSVATRPLAGGAWTTDTVFTQTVYQPSLGSVPWQDWIIGAGFLTGKTTYSCPITQDNGKTVTDPCATLPRSGGYSFSAGKQDLFVFTGGGGIFALPVTSLKVP